MAEIEGGSWKKGELVAAVSERIGSSLAGAELMLDAVLAAITEGVASAGAVELRGWGTIRVAVRPARKVRNPRTGEMVDVEPSVKVRMRPGKALVDAARQCAPEMLAAA